MNDNVDVVVRCPVCRRKHAKDVDCADVMLTCRDCGKQIKPMEEWQTCEYTTEWTDSAFVYRKRLIRPLCRECFKKRMPKNTFAELSGGEEGIMNGLIQCELCGSSSLGGYCQECFDAQSSIPSAQTSCSIPLWIDVEDQQKAGDTLTALEKFVYDNEPSGREEAARFVRQLTDVLQELNDKLGVEE